MPISNIHRHPELDILRTCAILMMVLYHLLFDLVFLYGANINVYTGGWRVMGRTAAILFLLLVGISFTLSWKRTMEQKHTFAKAYPKYAARGFFLLSWGMVISLATAITIPDQYIRFGILHVIGIATLLLPFFARLRLLNILLGIWFIGTGLLFQELDAHTYLLLPFGLSYLSFSTVDYFPLFPWFGVILLGMAIGHIQYIRNPAPPPARTSAALNILCWPGRHSLAIYLVHQPVLLVILHVAEVMRST